MKLRIVTVLVGLMALVAGWGTLRHRAVDRDLELRVGTLEIRVQELESTKILFAR
jgi:hypothetical protein